MFFGLDLYCTDPAQHTVTTDTGSTTVDYPYDLYDLDRDLSDVWKFEKEIETWTKREWSID